MRLLHVCALGALTAAAVACSHDTSGTLVTPDPVAGLRYVNIVPDTSGLDFRVVDVVKDAPVTVNATFRTGGAPYGIATPFAPPYFAVLAGTREIRVFPNSSNPDVASQVVYDTTFTFVQGQNYTVYLYGYARGTPTPKLAMMITQDSVPSLSAGKWAMRVIDLAATIAGNPLGSTATQLDARVALDSSAAPGTAQWQGVGMGGVTGYIQFDTASVAANKTWLYRLALYGIGTSGSSPIASQAVPPGGTRGTATLEQIPGTTVAGSAFSAVIVPQSVAGSAAPQGGTPADVTTKIDSVTYAGSIVTFWRSITPASVANSTCATPVAPGVNQNDVIIVSGLGQAQYNGSHAVYSVTAGTGATNYPACNNATLAPSKFSYRITGAPTSPATGTAAYHVLNTAVDFTGPYVVFLTDQKPPRTTP